MAAVAAAPIRKTETYTDTKRRDDVRGVNIAASCAVADAVRTSLGPRGMDKMISSGDNEVTITNDGATIVSLMALLQPAARMLADVSRSQAAAAGDDHVKGMPSGYEDMTVAQVSDGAKTWNRPMLEAALEYEQAHAARKGAISAIESALKAKEDDN
jgi:chaperonin GroEL (HSP60 family)